MELATVNVLAVLVSGVVNMALGMFWYSPALFGNTWIKLMGFTKAQMTAGRKKGMGKQMFFAFVATLAGIYILAQFLNLGKASTVKDALQIGALIWSFVAVGSLSMVIWEGKPFKLYLINVGHILISILISSAILVSWL